MRNLKIVVSAMLIFTVLAGIGYAFTYFPPAHSPPPPPVLQNIGTYDTCYCNLSTNATDQSACRNCHQSTGTNWSGGTNISGYNNTIGGVPTRHHSLVASSTTNPMTGTPFACTDCHPSIPGAGILLDRSCKECHNGTDWWGNSLGGHVGNFSRPHHVDTGYDDANIGQPAQNRTCNFCHGSVIDNYNDGHYKPDYVTDFMITPFATFKVTNFSQPNPILPVFNSSGLQVLNKTWGGCESCHLGYPLATPWPLCTNRNTHHADILGYPIGNIIQSSSTPGVKCSWCHVIDYTNSTGHGNTFPLLLNLTNQFTGETLINTMELRNSTIEQADAANGAF